MPIGFDLPSDELDGKLVSTFPSFATGSDVFNLKRIVRERRETVSKFLVAGLFLLRETAESKEK